MFIKFISHRSLSTPPALDLQFSSFSTSYALSSPPCHLLRFLHFLLLSPLESLLCWDLLKCYCFPQKYYCLQWSSVLSACLISPQILKRPLHLSRSIWFISSGFSMRIWEQIAISFEVQRFWKLQFLFLVIIAFKE